MYICKFCSKEYLKHADLKNHEKRCKSNPDRKLSNIDYTKRKNSNRFIAAKEKGLEIKVSQETRNKMSRSAKGVASTPEKELERKRKLSEAAKKNKLGGTTSKKRFNFIKKDGSVVHLQSSYEEKFARILDELSIEWCRPEPFLWVDDNGNSHRYYPDFKIGDVYIDTKNDFLAISDLPKIKKVAEQNNIDLRIITKNFINKEFIANLV